MNRNTESHFAELPQVDVPRSIFDMSHGHMTSFDCADLVPVECLEIVPGDTFKVTTSLVARLQTLLTPAMTNLYLDTYWFFVPMRLVWSHTKQFFGESERAWVPATTYRVPHLDWPENGFASGTIADYMGVPVGVTGTVGNGGDGPIALPFRAVAMICNEWFRDQNVSDPLLISTDDSTRTGSNGSNYITDVELGGKPFKVAKYHDYFTSCLPSPLKAAEPVKISSLINDEFPVYTGDAHTDGSKVPMLMHSKTGASHNMYYDTSNTKYRADAASNPTQPNIDEWPVNLWTHVYGEPNISVAELRLAFQTQKYYEKMARSGSRYREIIKEMFGCTSPDARMQIPEYLGGHRIPIQIHQVTNTSESASASLGDVGAMSNTSDVHEDFVKSFTEHGYLICCVCARYDHVYAQSYHKMWTRRDKLDFYWPVFQNLGEQPVKKKELMFKSATYTNGELDPYTNDDVFGFQEYAAEYRYQPSRVSGELRPGVPNSLASWNTADYYTEQPSLSDGWIREDKTNVDRILAVTSATSNQIFADFWFDIQATRPMPVYSMPGLVDHH